MVLRHAVHEVRALAVFALASGVYPEPLHDIPSRSPSCQKICQMSYLSDRARFKLNTPQGRPDKNTLQVVTSHNRYGTVHYCPRKSQEANFSHAPRPTVTLFQSSEKACHPL
jgi:hypothetical protein